MKRALTLAGIYVASCFVGTVLFAILFMFSCNITMFVTGLPASFFSLHFFLTGLLISFPLVCIIVQVLLILYMIRHPQKQVLSLICYAVFGLLSWLLFIPTDLKLIARYESDDIDSRIELTSPGVFRKESNGVFYYARIDEDGRADGLFIDTTGFLGTEGTVLPFFDVPVSNETAFPYSDILLKNALQPPHLVTYPLAVYNAILTAAQYSLSLGFLSWLCFTTFALALLSVYGIQFTSSWKLANVACVITAAVVVIFCNYLYYMDIMPAVLKEIAAKLSSLFGAKNPLIILINVLLTVICAGFGIVMGIYRTRSSQENEE